MTTAGPLVSFANVSKHYGEGTARVDVLRGVSFDVRAAEVVGLRGPSGSGKTTVLNIVGCILAPSEGTVRLTGEPVFADSRLLRSDLRWLRLDTTAHGDTRPPSEGTRCASPSAILTIRQPRS